MEVMLTTARNIGRALYRKGRRYLAAGGGGPDALGQLGLAVGHLQPTDVVPAQIAQRTQRLELLHESKSRGDLGGSGHKRARVAYGVHADVLRGKVVNGEARKHSVDFAQLGDVLPANRYKGKNEYLRRRLGGDNVVLTS
jgi:hypothetical protein